MSDVIVQSNYSQAMGFQLREAEGGRAVLTCELAAQHMNTRGVCHGGVISGLMDMAAGVATKSQLDRPDRKVATVSLTINYERPAELGHTLVAEALVRSGRRIVSCELHVARDDGEPVATGVATLSVR